MTKRDSTIVGGGAGGLVVASVAMQPGLKVTLIEKKNKLGGDCLPHGGVPCRHVLWHYASARRAVIRKTG
ncbi:MAG: NAD(P)-binding protein [Gammaproteobacteria bacterium]|nr:NAD(P)-binding protein [Gammaproteobacteria bacterium]